MGYMLSVRQHFSTDHNKWCFAVVQIVLLLLGEMEHALLKTQVEVQRVKAKDANADQNARQQLHMKKQAVH